MNKVLVTGATSGLGLAIAEKFLSAGKTVYIHGRSPDKIQTLLKNPLCLFVCHDLLDFENLSKLSDLVRNEQIDCFVSNAGVYSDQGVALAPDQCRNLLNVNLVAPIIVINDIYQYYKSKNAGTIVSINSVAGLYPNFSEAVYCASKHGLSGFIKSLQLDAYRHNLRILDYYPAAIQTRVTRNRAGYDNFIKPEDIADLIVSNVLSSQSFVPVSQELRRTPSIRP
jgi:NADP-dependent 3-hydroxy acid dehydrogenase YdfG